MLQYKQTVYAGSYVKGNSAHAITVMPIEVVEGSTPPQTRTPKIGRKDRGKKTESGGKLLNTVCTPSVSIAAYCITVLCWAIIII